MRRFKNTEMLLVFTYPKPMFHGAEDEILGSRMTVHKWDCTSNPHFNNNMARILELYDPFQRQTVHTPLDKVASCLPSN